MSGWEIPMFIPDSCFWEILRDPTEEGCFVAFNSQKRDKYQRLKSQMKRFAVRQRPLQPTKKIKVYHLESDGSFYTENGDRVSATMYEIDETSLKKATFLNRAKISIPKPPINTLQGYDAEVSHTFKRSNGFIKYIPLTIEEEENKVEYNLDYEDEEWITKHKLYGENAPEAKKLSMDLLERMLDATDKFLGRKKAEPSVDNLETLFFHKLQFNRVDAQEVCKHVLEYWEQKRKKLGKPLLRRFWPLTNANDSNPNLVFRPRGKDEHYRLRKKSKPDSDIYALLIELRANLEQAQTLCQYTHQREQIKLKKLMYTYETVVEVHYVRTNHTGTRPLTYNLKDTFMYKGRTCPILPPSSCSYATFNPIVNSSFGPDFRYNMKMNPIDMDMDDLTASSSPASRTHVSEEEQQYIQLLAISQLGGVYTGEELRPCSTPSLLINQNGMTDVKGTNWLLPVPGQSCYDHFYNPSCNDESYICTPDFALKRVRLRGRVGRGGRIILDRIKEEMPRFGDQSHEEYKCSLPIAATRKRPYLAAAEEAPKSTPTNEEKDEVCLVAPTHVYKMKNPIASMKRSYKEMTYGNSTITYHNLESAFSFNMSSEMSIHIDTAQRMILKRNNNNDQIQFFI